MEIVKYQPLLDATLVEELHQLQTLAVAELEPHVLRKDRISLEHFAGILERDTVATWVAFEDGQAVGLLLLDCYLPDNMWVNGLYLRERYPQEYEDGRAWYIQYAAILPGHQDGSILPRLIQASAMEAADIGAVVLFDLPGIHQPTPEAGLAQGTEALASEVIDVTMRTLDVVRWFVLEIGDIKGDRVPYSIGAADGTIASRPVETSA
jgi:hypothetical protein